MSQKIFLYWGSGSPPCWRIQLVLEEKNFKYEQKLLSFERQEHKSEEIMKLNIL
ncbi:glutathione S-transferase A-like [Brachionus plicatilis]|uniref:Glutathione S-transferase A-like n=1 Tax=Brachionus plicatilis TaxID=10195 RepID=A0A3M7SH35_BRAPC|nr:glutathione S-transferase A-like [Brachionus plicatilis]